MTYIDSGREAIYQETLRELLRRRFASLLTLLRGGQSPKRGERGGGVELGVPRVEVYDVL
jgi:hypothetical protein